MNVIIPAIIPKDASHLQDTLTRVRPFTRSVQVDIVDGVFVPFTSWPYSSESEIAHLRTLIEGFDVEVDLMLMEPETVVEEYVKAGVRSVVVHLESTQKLAEIIALKNTYTFKLGFSINNDTHLSVLTDVLVSADYVQLMGIAHIGSQGQPFDTRVLARISELKSMYPELLISIDGSVNASSLPRLVEAGARRFVSGSAILMHDSPQEAYDALCHM